MIVEAAGKKYIFPDRVWEPTGDRNWYSRAATPDDKVRREYLVSDLVAAGERLHERILQQG